MLFRKKQTKACAYCAHGTTLEDNTILCAKKGIREDTDSCRKFRYDPCKRIPPKSLTLDFEKYKTEDFSL